MEPEIQQIEIEDRICHELAWPVIGETSAAAGAKHGEPRRLDQLFRRGAGAGGVEGRVLKQPDELGGACFGGDHAAADPREQLLEVAQRSGYELNVVRNDRRDLRC